MSLTILFHLVRWAAIEKINFEYINKLKEKSNLILVTAITPTPAGEGKTTTSVGLNDGLNKIKKIDRMSQGTKFGPFGMKGGAAEAGMLRSFQWNKLICISLETFMQ